MASRLVVEILSDASKFDQGLDSAAKSLKGLEAETGKSSKTMAKLSTSFDAAKTAATAFVAIKVAQFVKDFAAASITAASDLEESFNAVNKVFGTASDRITAFGRISAQAAGLSQREFQQMATNTGALLINMGLSADEAAQQTVRLTQRGADLASVFNTDVGSALEAINAGLRGETESLRPFGVSLSDAAVKAKAVALGLAESTSKVDNYGKAQATLALIMEQSNSAAGDFLQTSKGLANQQRIAAAELENAQARLGTALVPLKSAVISFTSDLLLSFEALAGVDMAAASLRFQEAVEGIQDAATSGGDTFTALAEGIFHFARYADLTTAEFEALAAAAGLSEDQFASFLEQVLAQAEAMGKSPEVIDEVRAAIEGAGGAAGDSVGPFDEAGGAVEKLGNKAKSTKQQVKDLADELKAQADPVFAAVRALQNYRDTLQDIDEDGERTADETLDLAEALWEAETALRTLDQAGVTHGIDAIATALGTSRDAVIDLLNELGILHGTRVESLIDVKINVDTPATIGTLGNIEDAFNSITQPIDDIGGFKRAAGGPVSAGRPYLVGEQGPELFVPYRSGTIIPNTNLNTTANTVNITNVAPTTPDLDSSTQLALMQAQVILAGAL